MTPRAALRAAAMVVTAVALARAADPAAAATTVAFPTADGGPRAIALGGHIVALPIDDLALESNPARLAYATGSATAQYDRISPDLDLQRGRIGAAFALGPGAAEPLQLSKPVRMALGVSLASQGLTLIEGSSYREATLSAGLSYTGISAGAAGVAVRYQRAFSDVDGTAATGFGVDVGLSLDLADHWDIALSVTDAFGRTTYEDSDDEDRAARTTLGIAAVRRKWWQAELDYVLQYDAMSALAGGFEVHVVPGTLDLRLGVSQELRDPSRTVASAGAGLAFSAFRLDYAYSADDDGAFDVQHRIALGARF
jgi:hypothetical protein